MSTILQQLQETKAYIQLRVKEQASIGIILGSGLGNLASEIVLNLKFHTKKFRIFQ